MIWVIFFRTTTPFYGPYNYVISNGWVKGEGAEGRAGGGGVIIEKIFYCFISCFGPFAALFFTLKKLFILAAEGKLHQNNYFFYPFPDVFVTICHYLLLSVTISHFLRQYATIGNYLTVNVTICHYLSKSVTICHYLSLSVTICNYLSLSVTICNYLCKI